MDDAYLKERPTDVSIAGCSSTNMRHESITDLKTPSIVAAHDITRWTLRRWTVCVGLLTDVGGRTSHTAITARALRYRRSGRERYTEPIPHMIIVTAPGVIINPSES